jgi:hypothetical protein
LAHTKEVLEKDGAPKGNVRTRVEKDQSKGEREGKQKKVD